MKLLFYPNSCLYQQAKKIESITDEIRNYLPELFKIMYRSRGMALAAPQVGLPLSLVVANITGDPKRKDSEEVYINPEIIEQQKELDRGKEACLSLPGITVEIERARIVQVRYMDIEGKTVTRTAEGLYARMFQHEIDHLKGITIVDRMTAADRVKSKPFLEALEVLHKHRS